MMRTIFATIIFVALATTHPRLVHADSFSVIVEDPWSRATIGKKRPGVAYMTIRNISDTTIQLLSITTPIAKTAEIHRTTINSQGISSMAAAGNITIAPGESVKLEPGGLHAMFMHLQSEMNQGETLPLTLKFSDDSIVEVIVPILSISARGPKK